ncbi:MAG: LysE family transporter [Candidatus Izemoplasmatales bacterium]
MTVSVWIAFLSYALVTAYTPGPNNIISLNTTTKYGLKKSAPLRVGIGVGFILIMIITNGLTFFLGASEPSIIHYLKYIGAVYILYLAIKVALSKPIQEEGKTTRIPEFWTGFFLQFMNVKVILYGITAVSTFFLPYYSSIYDLIWFISILVANSLIAIWIWGLLGYALKNFINKHRILFNTIMALILLESAFSILLS